MTGGWGVVSGGPKVCGFGHESSTGESWSGRVGYFTVYRVPRGSGKGENDQRP